MELPSHNIPLLFSVFLMSVSAPFVGYAGWVSVPPPSISQPALGRSVTDPVTRLKTWRLGGSAAEMHRALAYPDGEGGLTPQHAQHYYSRVVPTNKDESYAVGSGGHKGGYAALWRIADKKLVKWIPTGQPNKIDRSLDHFGMRQVLWDQAINNVYWYTDGNRLIRATIDFANNYKVRTEQWDVFGGYDYITFGLGEGEFSDDGSRIVLVGSQRSTSASDEVIIAYDVKKKRQLGKRTVAPYQNNGLNWAGVDPTGTYIVFDQPTDLKDRGGIWTWVVPFDDVSAVPRLVYTHKKHSDFVIDPDGVPWLVYGNYQGVFAASLETTSIKRVWPEANISPSDNPGHSAFAPRPHINGNGHISRVAHSPGTILLGRNQHGGLYYLNIAAPGKIWHVGNTRAGGVNKSGETTGTSRYYREPRGSASNSGRYIFFVTDYKYDGSVHDPDTPYPNKSYLNMIELGAPIADRFKELPSH